MIAQDNLSVNATTDLPWLVAMSHIPFLRASHLRHLRAHFPSYEAIWQAGESELEESGMTAKQCQMFNELRRSLDPETLVARLEQEQIQTVTRDDIHYPTLLGAIYDPPALLYYRGTLPPTDALALGVVGSRLMTPYGRQMTEMLVRPIAERGLVIVSGLALGIDGLSHRTALAAGGTTVAIIGSGIDEASLYPSEHRELAKRIVSEGGAVLSEYPPGVRAARHHFPERNRIIAGWSRAVLVIEARQKSGALITARCAAEEGRDVLAVPGPITSPATFGPHALIRAGAYLATCANDVLEVLGLAAVIETDAPPIMEKNETLIWSMLSGEPAHIDALAEELKLDIAEITGTLALMEMKGLIREVGMMYYIRTGNR